MEAEKVANELLCESSEETNSSSEAKDIEIIELKQTLDHNLKELGDLRTRHQEGKLRRIIKCECR